MVTTDISYIRTNWKLNRTGWTKKKLEDIAKLNPYVPPQGPADVENVLFACRVNNRVEAIQYCWAGCISTGPDTVKDYCAEFVRFTFNPAERAVSNIRNLEKRIVFDVQAKIKTSCSS